MEVILVVVCALGLAASGFLAWLFKKSLEDEDLWLVLQEGHD